MNRRLHSTFLMIAALSPGAASAQDTFGAQGTIVPGGGVYLQQTRFDGPGGSAGGVATMVALRPELRYFIEERWSIGLGLSGGLYFVEGGRSYDVGARLSTGYFLPLGERFGLFPELALALSRSAFDSEDDTFSTRSHGMRIVAAAPIIVHGDSFFVGFGPELTKTIPVSTESNLGPLETYGSTTFGLTTQLGGWF